MVDRVEAYGLLQRTDIQTQESHTGSGLGERSPGCRTGSE